MRETFPGNNLLRRSNVHRGRLGALLLDQPREFSRAVGTKPACNVIRFESTKATSASVRPAAMVLEQTTPIQATGYADCKVCGKRLAAWHNVTTFNEYTLIKRPVAEPPPLMRHRRAVGSRQFIN